LQHQKAKISDDIQKKESENTLLSIDAMLPYAAKLNKLNELFGRIKVCASIFVTFLWV